MDVEVENTVQVSKNGKMSTIGLREAMNIVSRPDFLYFKCDICDMYPIVKHRWQCVQCDDFDMCDHCFKTGKHGHEKTHKLMRFQIMPVRLPQKNRTGGNELIKPTLTQSTLIRQQKNPSISKSASTLRGYLENLGIAVVLRKWVVKKCENCLRIYETGCDVYELQMQETQSFGASPLPEFVKRYFMHNALLLSEMLSTNYYKKMVFPKDPPDDQKRLAKVDFDFVRALLLGTIKQIRYIDDEYYGWFGHPVPKTTPRYYDVIKEPCDLSTIDSEIKNADPKMDPMKLATKTFRRVELIWSNAKEYNPDSNPVHIAAVELNFMCGMIANNFINIWANTREQYGSNDKFKAIYKSVVFEDVKNRTDDIVISINKKRKMDDKSSVGSASKAKKSPMTRQASTSSGGGGGKSKVSSSSSVRSAPHGNSSKSRISSANEETHHDYVKEPKASSSSSSSSSAKAALDSKKKTSTKAVVDAQRVKRLEEMFKQMEEIISDMDHLNQVVTNAEYVLGAMFPSTTI